MVLAEGIVIDSVYVLAVLGGAGGVVAALFRLLISSKDREAALIAAQKDAALEELKAVKESYKDIAAEALKSALETANYYRQKEGKAPIIPSAPVVSESHSPSTEKQREAAYVQTMRAKMALVKHVLGQEPRPEPPESDEPDKLTQQPLPETGLVVVTKQDVKELKADIAAAPEKIAEAVAEKVAEKLTEQGPPEPSS